MKIVEILVLLFVAFFAYDSLHYLIRNYCKQEISLPEKPPKKEETSEVLYDAIQKFKVYLLNIEGKWVYDSLLVIPLPSLICTIGASTIALVVVFKYSSQSKELIKSILFHRRAIDFENKNEKDLYVSSKSEDPETSDKNEIREVSKSVSDENLTILEKNLGSDTQNNLCNSRENSESNLLNQSFPFKIEVKCECSALSFEDRVAALEKSLTEITANRKIHLEQTEKLKEEIVELELQVKTFKNSRTSRIREPLTTLSREESCTSIRSSDLYCLKNLTDLIAETKKQIGEEDVYRIGKRKVDNKEEREEPQREKRSHSPWSGDSESVRDDNKSVLIEMRNRTGIKERAKTAILSQNRGQGIKGLASTTAVSFVEPPKTSFKK